MFYLAIHSRENHPASTKRLFRLLDECLISSCSYTLFHTPYFVFLQIRPCCFDLKHEIQKNNFPLNEATRANLQVNKRILKLRSFWNKMYLVEISVDSVRVRTSLVQLQNILIVLVGRQDTNNALFLNVFLRIFR